MLNMATPFTLPHCVQGGQLAQFPLEIQNLLAPWHMQDQLQKYF